MKSRDKMIEAHLILRIKLELTERYGTDGNPAIVIYESGEGSTSQRPALPELFELLDNLLK